MVSSFSFIQCDYEWCCNFLYHALNEKLKQNSDEGVIGSRFTWSFIRIVPVLVLLPVLSFTFFHLDQSETIFKLQKSQFDEFNFKGGGEVDELYRNTNHIAIKYYEDRTRNIAKLVNYFDCSRSSNEKMQNVLNLLAVIFGHVSLSLYDSQMNLAASSKRAIPIVRQMDLQRRR
jgi:hypothetical protein